MCVPTAANQHVRTTTQATQGTAHDKNEHKATSAEALSLERVDSSAEHSETELPEATKPTQRLTLQG